MSKVQYIERVNPRTCDLVVRLTQEYLAPQEGEVEPLLIEIDDKRRRNATQLYVIWKDWQHLTGQDRSEAIMEAYESAMGTPAALKVTVAMGLTPEEAERMGIHYAPTTKN